MKRVPLALVALAGLFIASTATAFFVFGNTAGPVTLPDSAFTDQTMVAMVVDFQQADDQAQQTFKDTITEIVTSVGEAFGDELPQAELDEMYAGMDRFFGAIADQQIRALGMTMDMDLNEIIRNGGEGVPPEPSVILLVNAGKKPNLVEIATKIMGEEVPAEVAAGMTQDVSFEALGGGWYAIDLGIPFLPFHVPGDTGDAAMAAKLNKAMAHTAGGLAQVSMVMPEDALNAMAGLMAAEMPADAPEAMREMFRAMTDMESASYAIDINEGIAVRYNVVFNNEDAAARMMTAYGEMLDDLPAFFEASMAANPMIGEQEKQILAQMQDQMVEMIDLMTISQEGATIKMQIDADGFSKMIELMTEIMQSAALSV